MKPERLPGKTFTPVKQLADYFPPSTGEWSVGRFAIGHIPGATLPSAGDFSDRLQWRCDSWRRSDVEG